MSTPWSILGWRDRNEGSISPDGSVQQGKQMLETFLTAYDPSDLPGTSIDPLGFERGYLFLADKILPGLTNVASRPRYFALLCTGILLSGDTADNRREVIRKHRREIILRLERFWALANVLARPDGSDGVR